MQDILASISTRAPQVSESTAPEPYDDGRGVSVLVVDDEYTLRESCASLLRAEEYTVVACGSRREAEHALTRRSFDIALVDLYLDGASGLDVLAACRETNPECLVVVMTGNPSVDSSVEALRSGAWDYLPKPFTATQLQILVGSGAQAVRARQERRSAAPAQGSGAAGETRPVGLLGHSPLFLAAVERARRVAATQASVFISGESGTGKEMIAQYIHAQSRRASGPLVAVNCAALPEGLLESEMFGHVKGAFTGAVRDKVGLLEAAHGGTLFLDELTEMPLTIQAKLLRVIQDGAVRRVGSESTDAVVDVRFVAATNRDPLRATTEGVLRQDLFYRLSVVPISLPALRDRPEDIPILAEHFLAVHWKRHRGADEPIPHLGREASAELFTREWRGNVRELQNVIEHAVVLLEPGAEIRPEDIPFREEGTGAPRAGLVSARVVENPYHVAREQVLTEFERVYLSELMQRAGSNMSRAAKIAGVDRTTLYRLMEKHGLYRDTIIKAG
ncbi:MAG TPA: sigma-54 dependent transcriptional regulator [Longimicrobium sp.]|jgi:DNA-binding NtrC family response regulator|nr:sigma-54 dependent transcriptional regulator [Longimicrobium sp.]